MQLPRQIELQTHAYWLWPSTRHFVQLVAYYLAQVRVKGNLMKPLESD